MNRTQACTHCCGDGYIETDCACHWPTCRVCNGTGVIGGVA